MNQDTLMTDSMKNTAILLIIIGAMIGILILSSKHDKAITASAERYEKCVEKEYHTTPSEWYNEHGEYPVCGE